MSELEHTLCVNCGVTLAGIKPASLFSIKSEAVKNLKDYKRVFLSRGVEVRFIKLNGDRMLVYAFKRNALEKILSDKDNAEFLKERGYDCADLDGALKILIRRLRFQSEFPHEIGIFLGYALEDVKGFIASPRDGVYFTGYWKVYAHAEEKSLMFARYRFCTDTLERKLKSGESLNQIFKVA